MTTSNKCSALDDLCTYLQGCLGADLVLAVEGNIQGQGMVLGPERLLGLRGITLQFADTNGITQQRGAEARLPAALAHALGEQPAQYLWLPVDLPHAPRSGVLVLWRTAPEHPIKSEGLTALAVPFAVLMSLGMKAREERALQIRFNDLVESVPSGILLISGDGREAFVNGPAARYLDCAPGPHSSADISTSMRALREKCDNVEELSATYATRLSDPDFSLKLQWNLPGLTLEVDTHPLRGDGRNGRLWVMNDVTAATLMAAHLKRLAALDPLTGIPNRRHFEERSIQILAARESSGNRIGVLMLDIDHFKRINDTYGHAIGDGVLKIVASRCRNALRDRDLFARFGGEEFVAMISLNSGESLDAQAEMLRCAIGDSPVVICGQEIPVTISIGGASGEAVKCFSMEYVLARADAALYGAKAAGRNQSLVVVDS